MVDSEATQANPCTSRIDGPRLTPPPGTEPAVLVLRWGRLRYCRKSGRRGRNDGLCNCYKMRFNKVNNIS